MLNIENCFTTIDKDFINVADVEEMTGLSANEAMRLIREVKSVSDIWGLKGKIHRLDYLKFMQHQMENGVHSEDFGNKR